jgi:hypothetical protein
MGETYVPESQGVFLLAAVGDSRRTTGSGAEEEEKDSGVSASSLSWVLLGGAGAGLRLLMYFDGRNLVGRRVRRGVATGYAQRVPILAG